MPVCIGGEYIDIVSNVIYTWGRKAAHRIPRSLNLIHNSFIGGPVTGGFQTWTPNLHSTTADSLTHAVFEFGNTTEGFSKARSQPSAVYADALFTPYSIKAEIKPKDAYNQTADNACANKQVAGVDGAFHTIRDHEDTRIINNLINRKCIIQLRGSKFDFFKLRENKICKKS